MSKRSYRITQESIDLIKSVIPEERLSKLLPFTEDKQFDLLNILTGFEVELAQSEDAGEKIDEKIVRKIDNAIDEINRLDLNLKDLTDRLKQ